MDASARRFLSIVVVAMLLLGGMLTALMLLPEPDDRDDGEEDPGWRVMNDDAIIVYDDAVWSGWDTVVEHPVFIEAGCTLTVEGSRLEVPLERMVFEDLPPFTIGPDAEMVLSNSTLVVDGDPQLATAIFDGEPHETSTPFICRVVNLMEASRPVLEVELELVRGEPYVVVAAQRPGENRLEALAVVEPEELEAYEWVPVRVSLDEYAGGTPRLVVFVHNSTAAEVMISNITVRDGDDPLPGDAFGLGGLEDDGWDTQHLVGLVDAVGEGNWRINPLIEGWDGDLRVLHSRILSLPGLQHSWRPYRPQMGSLQGGVHSNMWKAPDEGAINVSGDVRFLSSEVAFVPIKVDGALASFQDCSFVGDCDMLTIGQSKATVSGCDFGFRALPGLWGRRSIDEGTLMLSMERTYGDTIVEDCTFTGEGNGTGLAVNNQVADLRSCSFSGLDVGVWVHEGGPSMEWEDLRGELSFDGSCPLEYLETQEVRVDFAGDEMPSSGFQYRQWTSNRFDELPGLADIQFPELETAYESTLCVPLTAVTPEGGVHRSSELEVWISPHWAYNKLVTIDPRLSFHLVIFEQEDGGSGVGWFVLRDIKYGVGNSTGAVVISLALSVVELVELGDVYLNLSVDGAMEDHRVLNTTAHERGYFWVNLETVLSPGPHVMNYTVGLDSEAWNLTLEVDRLDIEAYRVSDGSMAEELNRWLPGRRLSVTLIDPGVVVDGLEFVNENASSSLWINFIAGDGSQVTLERISMEGRSDCGIITAGSGTLLIGDVSCDDLSLITHNSTVRVGEASGDSFYGVFHGAEVSFSGDLSHDNVYLMSFNGSSIAFDGVAIDVEDRFSMSVWGTEMTMEGCTFTSGGGGRAGITTVYTSTLSIEDCRFDGVPLTIDFFDMNDTCQVVDCTFSGRRAFLCLNMDRWLLESGRDLATALPRNGTVSGNTFTGEGTGLIFLPLFRDTILGANDFLDGARAYSLHNPERSDYDIAPVTMDSMAFHMSTGVAWEGTDPWFDHLVDVTDDPLEDRDPGPVLCMVRRFTGYYNGPRGPVVGFQYITIDDKDFTLDDYSWTRAYRLYGLVEELERELGKMDNWWTG